MDTSNERNEDVMWGAFHGKTELPASLHNLRVIPGHTKACWLARRCRAKNLESLPDESLKREAFSTHETK